MATTYSELITEVQDELADNTELTDEVVKRLIGRGEAKLNRRCRLRAMEKLKSRPYTIDDTTARINHPIDMVEMLYVQIKRQEESDSDYYNLQYVTPHRMPEYADLSLGYYTLRDRLELNATVVNPHTVRMHYIGRFDIATNLTNWLLTNAPDLYLYAACAEATLYFKDKEAATYYAIQLREGIRDLNSLDERGRDDGVADIRDYAYMTGGSYAYRYRGYGGSYNIAKG
jgi:hypothetical protein